jgi:hypothetical protein
MAVGKFADGGGRRRVAGQRVEAFEDDELRPIVARFDQ